MKYWIALFSFWLANAGFSQVVLKGESQGMGFQVEQLLEGLGVPWGLDFLDSDTLLITERSGKLKRFDLQTKTLSEIRGLPRVLSEGQGGLLDIKLSPNFKNDAWVYFTYSKAQSSGGTTALARARYTDRSALSDWQDLLVTKTNSDTSRHYGSRIAFDESDHVFFGVGDRGIRDNAQDTTNHAGSVIRLNLDGTIPKDNPFIAVPNTQPEIWSYGHRNPQGIAYDKTHHRLWLIEHGPRGGDEINLIEPGKNYGWPVISYGKEYWGPIAVGEGTEKAGMEQPVKYYVPSIAPGSLLYYSGKAFPKWRNHLFAGALKLTHLNLVLLNERGLTVGEERLLSDLHERIRALQQSPEGWIYLSTDSGKLLRLRPTL